MPLTGEYEPSTSDWAREQAERFESSHGAEANTLRGLPIIVMTSVGAKSGKLRKTPLMRVEHDGEYALVASKGGAPQNPVWYNNLKKNPHVELQDGPVKRDYMAREVSGDERAAWWERCVAAYPDYADYQKKTDRQIPVFVLAAIKTIIRPERNRAIAADPTTLAHMRPLRNGVLIGAVTVFMMDIRDESQKLTDSWLFFRSHWEMISSGSSSSTSLAIVAMLPPSR